MIGHGLGRAEQVVLERAPVIKGNQVQRLVVPERHADLLV
jgi:hypothetical protein